MKKGSIIIVLSFLVMGFSFITANTVDPAEVKTAINKSLPLLQQTSHTFLENAGGCHSCHGEGLGGITFSLAKEMGFSLKDTISQEVLDSIYNDMKGKSWLAQNEDPAAIVIASGYAMWTFASNNRKPDKTTELLAKNILQRQRKDGSWVSPNARPPLEYYSFSATALSAKLIQFALPPLFEKEVKQRVARATTWMMQTPVINNEERVFQLLGLTWCKGDTAFISQQAKKLLATQRPDGGWSQLVNLPSDAYATGQSLYALFQSGAVQSKDAAYQKGIQFLLRTQLPDGSWKVKTRSFPSIPFVDSGFPHGGDQFISTAGSHWATLALLLSLK